MTPAIPLTRLGDRANIGLLADTHCHAPGASDLPQAVLDAFRGVDVVVHLGDMGDATVLDRLATVADVVATRGRDDPPEDPRIAASVRVIEAGGLVVGALFDLATAGLASVDGDRLDFGDGFSPELLQRVFGRHVDVVAFGATHRDVVAFHRGVLLVNPGSPTLPARRRAGMSGTAAVLELGGGVALVEIVTFGGPR
jgi:putative phosphoesterase